MLERVQQHLFGDAVERKCSLILLADGVEAFCDLLGKIEGDGHHIRVERGKLLECLQETDVVDVRREHTAQRTDAHLAHGLDLVDRRIEQRAVVFVKPVAQCFEPHDRAQQCSLDVVVQRARSLGANLFLRGEQQ